MAARSNAAVESNSREFVITRVLDAPRALVWKALTEPERLEHWCQPRALSECTVRCPAFNDIRRGDQRRRRRLNATSPVRV